MPCFAKDTSDLSDHRAASEVALKKRARRSPRPAGKSVGNSLPGNDLAKSLLLVTARFLLIFRVALVGGVLAFRLAPVGVLGGAVRLRLSFAGGRFAWSCRISICVRGCRVRWRCRTIGRGFSWLGGIAVRSRRSGPLCRARCGSRSYDLHYGRVRRRTARPPKWHHITSAYNILGPAVAGLAP